MNRCLWAVARLVGVSALAVISAIILAILSIAQEVSSPTSTCPARPAATSSLDVLFTGKTFGYLRVDHPEKTDVIVSREECKAKPAPRDDNTCESKHFFGDLMCEVGVQTPAELRTTTGKEGKPVLIGLGDNFGPRLEARMEDPDITHKRLRAQEQRNVSGMKCPLMPVAEPAATNTEPDGFWRWRSRNPGLDDVAADPVAQLLMKAGYNAVVPGREDFGLGPERLRNIANYMRCNPDSACKCQAGANVRMLASNLFIGTTYKKVREPLADELKKLRFKTRHNLIRPLDSAPFLPILQYLKFSVLTGANGKIPLFEAGAKPVEVCPAMEKKNAGSDYSDPDQPDFSKCYDVAPEVKAKDLDFREMVHDFVPEATGRDDSSKPGGSEKEKRAVDEYLKSNYKSGYIPVSKVVEQHQASLQRQGVVPAEKEVQAKKADLFQLSQTRTKVTVRVPVCKKEQQGSKCLEPDKNYFMCFYEPEDEDLAPAARSSTVKKQEKEKRYCQRIPVSRAFFQDDFVYLDRRKHEQQAGDEKEGANDVLIFGITDPDLSAGLSDSAGSWLERIRKKGQNEQSPYVCDNLAASQCPDPGRKIRVESAEASAVLGQLADYAALTCLSNPGTPGLGNCERKGADFKGKKILLAQMGETSARELISHLDGISFDLVFAKADRSYVTPSMTKIEDADAAPPILVAQPISDDTSEKLYRVISRVSLAPDPSDAKKRRIEVKSPPASCKDPGDCYRRDPGAAMTPKETVPAEKASDVGSAKQASDDKSAESLRYLQNELSKTAWQYLCQAIGNDRDDEIGSSLESLCKSYPSLPETQASASSSFVTEAILQIMRRKANADVAMLERRDLFTFASLDDIPQGGQAIPLQKILDRILWEGSTLQKITITGANLKATLKRSKQYLEAEGSTTSTPHIFGLPLVYSGIQPGRGKDEYIVNGTLIDDAKPYSIALAEHPMTSTGDYPELQKQVDGETSEVDSSLRARYISHVVCEELAPFSAAGDAAKVCDLGARSEKWKNISAERKGPGMSYFASCPKFDTNDILHGDWAGTEWNQCPTKMLSPPETQGHEGWGGFIDWSHNLKMWVLGAKPIGAQGAYSIPELAEAANQQEASAELKISEMSVAFTDFSPTLGPKDLNTRFPAPALSTVNQSQATSWAITNNTRFRALHSWLFGKLRWSPVDQYSSLDVSYASQKQEKSGGPQITRTHNEWAAVPLGWEFTVPVFTKSSERLAPREYIVVEPDRLRGQLRPMDSYLSVEFPQQAGACVGNVVGGNCVLTQHVRQDETFAWTPRVGYRYENKVSYAELGYQGAYNWRLPRAFLFNAPGSANFFVCPDPNNLGDCLNANGPNITPSTAASELYTKNWQHGPYLDSVLRVPLPPWKKGFYYQVQNKDEFFFPMSGDTASLTRYDLTMTHSVNIPIFWNFSLSPTIELFWYENQVNRDTLFRPTYTMKLNWTLDQRFKRVPAKETWSYSPFADKSSKTDK